MTSITAAHVASPAAMPWRDPRRHEWTMHDAGTAALSAGFGAITAVVARAVSRLRAVRSRGTRPPEPVEAAA